jgi:carbamoyl-phosphate synthase large subunit
MRKIFILGGSSLQLDLILEAKRMFFYTIVIDASIDCIGTKWCDEFLHIDISDKETILIKAKEYNIDVILTSATEIGNITACWVGEQLGLNTNSYQTAINTTNKALMKSILVQNNILTARYAVIKEDNINSWNLFPAIVKPSDSSAGRGLSYVSNKAELQDALIKAKKYSNSNKLIVEEYIDGRQFSIETISCNCIHQIIAINHETIREVPHIIESSHEIPAEIDQDNYDGIVHTTNAILNSFNIRYGACHIELKITPENKIYIIELASRTGGMRSEMINLAYGISYSQLLLLSALNNLSKVQPSRHSKVKCNFIVDYKSYQKYLELKNNQNYILFQPSEIEIVNSEFKAFHLGESRGYYFLLLN